MFHKKYSSYDGGATVVVKFCRLRWPRSRPVSYTSLGPIYPTAHLASNSNDVPNKEQRDHNSDVDPKGNFGQYSRVVKQPLWRHWALASGVARVPVAMVPFAFVLAGQYATGSFAAGALLTSLHAMSEALVAPWGGRVLDRSEIGTGLRRALTAEACLLALMAVATWEHAPLLLLVFFALAIGGVPAAVPGGFLATLPTIVPTDALASAFALDATLLEIEWMAAPPLVSAAVLLGTPVAALLLMAGVAVIAVLTVRRLPLPRVRLTGVSSPTPWRRRSARFIYTLACAMGVALGAIDATLPPLMPDLGARPAFAGFLAGVLAIASALGGFVYGTQAGRWPGTPRGQASALLAIFGGLLLPLAFVHSIFWAAVVLIIAGALLAPMNALRQHLLQELLPTERRAEGFSLLYASTGLGYAGGGLLTAALLHSVGARGIISVAALTPLVVGLMAMSFGARIPWGKAAGKGGRGRDR